MSEFLVGTATGACLALSVTFPRLRWALVKAVWAMAACAFTVAVYEQAMPRFY